MARGAREDDGVAEERLVLDRAVPGGGADDAQLERPAGDVVDDGLGVEDEQRDVEGGVVGGEAAEKL